MTQPSLLEGEQRKVAGKAKVSANPEAQAWLRKARAYAVWHLTIGKRWWKTCDPKWRTIRADIVRQHVPLPPNVHHNTVGSLFNDKRFKPVGWQKNERPESHARSVQEWVLA